MRFAVASSVVMGGMLACASFGSEDAGTQKTSPDASTNAGDAASGDSGAVPSFECPEGVAFCDDFKRANTNDVRGDWSELIVPKPEDPPAKIENGAFHLFAAASSTEGTRTYLDRTLQDCEGAKISIRFDVKLSSPRRHSNLSVITLDHDGTRTFVSLALVTDSNPRLELAINDDGVPHDIGPTSAPPADGAWATVEYTVDLTNLAMALAIHGESAGNFKRIDPRKNLTGCRFSIGNDYIDFGEASERWYDNVVARVEKP